MILHCAYGYIPPGPAHPEGAHLVRGQVVPQAELGVRLAESAAQWRREMQVEEDIDEPSVDRAAAAGGRGQ